MINFCKFGIHNYEIIQEETTSYISGIRFDHRVTFKLRICKKCNKVDRDGVKWNILTDEFLQNKIRENRLKKILK